MTGALEQALDQVRSGARPVIATPTGPAPMQVLLLFLLASAAVLVMAYALVRQVGLPQWMFWLAVVLMLAGLPIMMLTARAERLKAQGNAEGGLMGFLNWRRGLAGGVLAFAGWGALAATLLMRSPSVAATRSSDGVRLAVLPFTNRGDPDDAYFADGIADEVRGKLAGLGNFQLTARSSSDQYRESTKTPQVIGRELGVDYLLSATVRWAKAADGTSRVQVLPELIDARTGDVTWQQTYDANLTDVFQVQTQIASRVAGALGVALGSQQQQELAERPTDNLAAYDLYLKGLAQSGQDPASLRRTVAMFEQAVALDSSFAEAWFRLSSTLGALYSNSTPDPEVGRRALAAAERTMRIDPDGPLGYAAMARYHSSVTKNIVEAERLIGEALKLAPNDPNYLGFAGQVERSNGRYEEALAHAQQAFRLDPRSVRNATRLQTNYMWLRRYPEALGASEAALALAPGDLSISQDKAMVYLGMGDLAGAREVVKQVSPAVAAPELVAFFGQYWDMYWVLDEAQQQLLLRLTPSAFDNDRSQWATVLMQLYELRRDRARSRAYADTAWQANQEQIRGAPNDGQRHVIGGLQLAYMGRKDEAIAQGFAWHIAQSH
jgi:TolB-like protein/cytochrome c-type biogenesis protein CcmH/NrfG